MYALTRLKHLVWSYGPTVALAFLVLTVSGAAATGWLETNPKTTTVTDHHNRQTAKLEVGTTAVVEGSGHLYPSGTTLSNKPFYLYNSTPNITVVTTTAIPDAARADVSHRVTLVYKVVSSEETYWQRTQTLKQTNASGTSVTTDTTIDMVSLHETASRISQRAGDVARVVVQLRVRSQYTTDAYSGEFTKTIPIVHGPMTYSFPHDTWTKSHSQTTQRTVTIDRPWWVKTGAMGATGLGILGLLVIGLVRYRIEQPATLAYEIHRERYSEWISAGIISADLDITVIVETLEDLVDVAIDTNERVVYDRPSERYYVITGESVYAFDPSLEDERTSDTAIDEMALRQNGRHEDPRQRNEHEPTENDTSETDEFEWNE